MINITLSVIVLNIVPIVLNLIVIQVL